MVEQAAWRQYGDGEAQAVFLPANGFPVGSYDFLLHELAEDLPLLGLENRGAWPDIGDPPAGFGWRQHAQDVLDFLDARSATGPLLGIGHSIGATVLAKAAQKQSGRFSRLILIDPATIPGRWAPWLVSVFPSITKRMDLVARTRNRRQFWESREAFASSLRGRSAYKRFTEPALTDYARAGLKPARAGLGGSVREGGSAKSAEKQFELTYRRDWEAWNFQHTSPFWPVLKRLKMPVLLLRGEHSYLHPDQDFQRRCRRLPANITALSLPAGHMLPQEIPDRVLVEMRNWLQAD